MKITKGTTRIVFMFSKIVIKIPNFTYSHQNFLKGCLANYNERWFCLKFKGLKEFEESVIPSLFCSAFGLILIQKRAKPLPCHLGAETLDTFKSVCKDIKPNNFGLFRGRIVCIDYG